MWAFAELLSIHCLHRAICVRWIFTKEQNYAAAQNKAKTFFYQLIQICIIQIVCHTISIVPSLHFGNGNKYIYKKSRGCPRRWCLLVLICAIFKVCIRLFICTDLFCFKSEWSLPVDQQGSSPACVRCWPSSSRLSRLLSSPQSETQMDLSSATRPRASVSHIHLHLSHVERSISHSYTVWT